MWCIIQLVIPFQMFIIDVSITILEYNQFKSLIGWNPSIVRLKTVMKRLSMLLEMGRRCWIINSWTRTLGRGRRSSCCGWETGDRGDTGERSVAEVQCSCSTGRARNVEGNGRGEGRGRRPSHGHFVQYIHHGRIGRHQMQQPSDRILNPTD